MIKSYRDQFNQAFSPSKYEELLSWVVAQHHIRPPFKVSETPIFVPKNLKDQLLEASSQIIDVLVAEDFKEKSQGAVFPEYEVPNESEHPNFLSLDFGICQDEDGNVIPQLIEGQGFPSLFHYQNLIAKAYREVYSIPAHLDHFFEGFTENSYLEKLKRIIIGHHDPKEVVILEIEPYKQPTAIDFIIARDLLGIKILCVTDVKKMGRELFYFDDYNALVKIKRIYNRVIFDELAQKNQLKRTFKFTDDLDVEWAGHPNWFFRISKYTLSFLNNKYVPDSYLLSELTELPENLSDFVLKPLFSFSGAGVKIDFDKKDLDAIENKHNYMLQKKVEYIPIIETLDIPAKMEVRLLLIWEDGDDRPSIATNLIRLSKGKMIGVRYNKGLNWVGGSIGFFE